jgi:hypothetical protein
MSGCKPAMALPAKAVPEYVLTGVVTGGVGEIGGAGELVFEVELEAPHPPRQQKRAQPTTATESNPKLERVSFTRV